MCGPKLGLELGIMLCPAEFAIWPHEKSMIWNPNTSTFQFSFSSIPKKDMKSASLGLLSWLVLPPLPAVRVLVGSMC